MLPPLRVAVRLPAVRTAAALVVIAPVIVLWVGESGQQAVRLRVVGMLLAAAAAMVWDDRSALLTAPTPVGLPAVRHGRALVVAVLLLAAWGLACLAARGNDVPYGAVSLQSGVVAVLLVALVGWLSRDREGEQLLALPVPLLLVVVVALSRLPRRFSLLTQQPGDVGWPGERTRWLVLLGLSLALTLRLDRDPAARRSLSHSRGAS